MKKLILTIGFLSIGTTALFAQKYMTRTGRITFDASTPTSPEKVDAKNNEVASIVDSKTGEIVFQAPIKSFKFERQLMEEHFNEKYMESDKFPKSEFKGKIANIADINFTKDGTYKATATGKLSMHGVTNDVTVPGIITVSGNKIKMAANFKVKLADYKLEVPKLVSDKLATVASVILDAELTQQNQK